MDTTDTDTKYCSNCRRDIAVANFVMHETHCRRNIILCELCQEPVPRSQTDEHFDEFHAKVKCECGVSVEKMNLDDHKESQCQNRQVVCKYCEGSWSFSEHQKHEIYCGTRTEECEICHKFIMIKDLESHQLTNCAEDIRPVNVVEPQPVENRFRMEFHDIPGYESIPGFQGLPVRHFNNIEPVASSDIDVPDLQSDELKSVYDALSGRESVMMGDILSEMNPILQEALAKNAKSKYEHNLNEENSSIRGQSKLHKDKNNGHGFLSEYNVDDDFNNDSFLTSVLAENMNDIKIDSVGSHRPFSNEFPQEVDMDLTESDHDTTILPCEFCEALFPADLLLVHQRSCEPQAIGGSAEDVPMYNELPPRRSTTLSRETQPPLSVEADVPVSYGMDEVDERTAAVKATKRVKAEMTKPAKDTNKPPETVHDDDDTIPCEFCSEPFPPDALWQHQAWCGKLHNVSVFNQELNNETRPTPEENDSNLVAEATARQRMRKKDVNTTRNLYEQDEDDYKFPSQPQGASELRRKHSQTRKFPSIDQGSARRAEAAYVPSFPTRLASKSLPNVNNVIRDTDFERATEYVPADLGGVVPKKKSSSMQRLLKDSLNDLRNNKDLISSVQKPKRPLLKTGGITRPINNAVTKTQNARPTGAKQLPPVQEPVIDREFFNPRPQRPVHRIEKAKRRPKLGDGSSESGSSSSSSRKPDSYQMGRIRARADAGHSSRRPQEDGGQSEARTQRQGRQTSSKVTGSPPER